MNLFQIDGIVIDLDSPGIRSILEGRYRCGFEHGYMIAQDSMRDFINKELYEIKDKEMENL